MKRAIQIIMPRYKSGSFCSKLEHLDWEENSRWWPSHNPRGQRWRHPNRVVVKERSQMASSSCSFWHLDLSKMQNISILSLRWLQGLFNLILILFSLCAWNSTNFGAFVLCCAYVLRGLRCQYMLLEPGLYEGTLILWK